MGGDWREGRKRRGLPDGHYLKTNSLRDSWNLLTCITEKETEIPITCGVPLFQFQELKIMSCLLAFLQGSLGSAGFLCKSQG